ncbi:MAG: alpha/beta hydrolase [Thiogranum sp.]|nr:alpha/beta hydrolase [Thiogranum sp.]
MKLVLLPGLHGTADLFQPFAQALPGWIDPQVIAYPTHEKLSYTELAEYVMQRLPGEDDYVLLGESFSGPVVHAVALRAPPRLRGAVFVATFLSNPRPWTGLLVRVLPKARLLELIGPRPFVKAFTFGIDVSDELVRQFLDTVNTVAPEVLAFRLDEIQRLRAAPRHCALPAIYLRPTGDRLLPPSCVDEFRAVMDNLIVRPVAGPHFILQWDPVGCARIVSAQMEAWTRL